MFEDTKYIKFWGKGSNVSRYFPSLKMKQPLPEWINSFIYSCSSITDYFMYVTQELFGDYFKQ